MKLEEELKEAVTTVVRKYPDTSYLRANSAPKNLRCFSVFAGIISFFVFEIPVVLLPVYSSALLTASQQP